jgi:3-oxoacyl-[acyl-carrier-protein] synthase-3
MSLFLHAVAAWHPGNIISNEFLEELGYTPTERKLQRKLGIETRRTVLDLNYIRQTRNTDIRAAREATQVSDARAGSAALQCALARLSLKAPDVGLMVTGSSAPEYTCPAQACIIANELGMSCIAFDLSSACNTALIQLDTIDRMAAEELPDYIALLQIENVTRSVDYWDAVTAALMGDCATALVVSKRIPAQTRINVTKLRSDFALWENATISRFAHFAQDGRQVRRVAKEFLCSCAGTGSRMDRFVIPHQTSMTVLEEVRQELSISPERFLTNVARFGNCGAAGAISVLAENWNMLADNAATVELLTIGAGMTWGSTDVVFSSVCSARSEFPEFSEIIG